MRSEIMSCSTILLDSQILFTQFVSFYHQECPISGICGTTSSKVTLIQIKMCTTQSVSTKLICLSGISSSISFFHFCVVNYNYHDRASSKTRTLTWIPVIVLEQMHCCSSIPYYWAQESQKKTAPPQKEKFNLLVIQLEFVAAQG